MGRDGGGERGDQEKRCHQVKKLRGVLKLPDRCHLGSEGHSCLPVTFWTSDSLSGHLSGYSIVSNAVLTLFILKTLVFMTHWNNWEVKWVPMQEQVSFLMGLWKEVISTWFWSYMWMEEDIMSSQPQEQAKRAELIPIIRAGSSRRWEEAAFGQDTVPRRGAKPSPASWHLYHSSYLGQLQVSTCQFQPVPKGRGQQMISPGLSDLAIQDFSWRKREMASQNSTMKWHFLLFFLLALYHVPNPDVCENKLFLIHTDMQTVYVCIFKNRDPSPDIQSINF